MSEESQKETQEVMNDEAAADGVVEETADKNALEDVAEEKMISYNYSDLRSKAERVKMSEDAYLQLHHSFGYECQKRNNLVVLDKTTVAFSAGNHTQLLNLISMEQQCLRSLGGGGIGTIAVHPSRKWLAIGEKGTQPVIAVFSFPQLQLHRILRGGTEEMYSHMNFSSGEGELLASVGGHPDFMLTVWDWNKENIVLRCKAFSQDVFRVSFSPDNPGQLTTSGTGHIRFWKMATTFTGLKLQGQLGKFGRTELSDIAAYVELPDGKVLSGTEWGNLLLWDGGFIKVEISRKNHKYCHQGMIEALFLDDGELISAGVDGYIRIWDFETIDNADITDENAVFEMDPLTEIRVGHDVSLKTLVRSADPDTPTIWYAQDSAGAIWRVDITSSYTRSPPEKLVSYHSGSVCGVCCSPVGHQAASIGYDGSVRIYDLDSKQLLCHTHFSGGGASLIWAPPTVKAQSTILLSGSRDGVLRVLNVEQSKKREGGYQLTLKHACKPHCQPVTCLSVHPQGNILATGSADSTVFFLDISENYRPMGFIRTPSSVTSLHWTCETQRYLLVACCEDGSVVEIRSPLEIEYDISKTFHLEPLPCHVRSFTSIKDRLRLEEEEARQAAERERKRKEKEAAKQRKREEMGEDYVSEEEAEEEEEGREGDGEEENEEEEEEKPKGPSPILSALAQSTEREFWVSMGGYDAGYLYQISMDGAGPVSEPYHAKHSIAIPSYDGKDLPIHSMIMSSSGCYLLTGSSNGVVRIHPLSSPLSPSSSLSSYWALTVHDNQNGAIGHISTTTDDRYVVTGGTDGNIFVFSAHLPTPSPETTPPSVPLEVGSPSKPAKDIDDPNHYSIEDAKQKTEHDRQLKQAEMKKHSVRKEVGRLRRTFLQLVQQNQDLPLPLQLATDEFIMDPSLEAGMRERTQEQVELVKKEMAWNSEKHTIALEKLEKWFKSMVECERIVVWSFDGDHCVSSYCTPRPSGHFIEQLEKELSFEILQTPGTVAATDRGRIDEEINDEEDSDDRDGMVEIEGGDEVVKVSKQEARRLRREKRKREWEELMFRKPGKGEDDPEEAAMVAQFRANMGDYHLKTSSDYVVPKHQRVTFSKKRRSLLLLRNQIFQKKRDYNDKLIALRDKKKIVLKKASELRIELEAVQNQLPPSLHLTIPSFPAYLRPEEEPESTRQFTKDSLLKFAAEKEEKERLEREAAAGVGEGFGGFGGFGGGGEGGKDEEEGVNKREVDDDKEEEEKEEKLSAEMVEVEEQSKPDSEQEREEGTVEEEKGEKEEAKEIVTMQQSQLGLVLQQERQVQLLFKQRSLVQEIEEMKTSFDEALLRLRHEKTELDCTTITASLRHITQYQELTLLREFEKKEKTFTSRYQSKKTESREMETKIQGLALRLKQMEKKLSQLQEQEKSLTNQFLERVGDGNKFKDFLLKVFRKKIKRAKVKDETKKSADGEEEDEDEDSDDESDISSSEEESEVGEGALDDTVCPAGCDPSLFNLACSLRETRLDLEEALVEEKRATDQTRKELESSKKKLKTMESHVKTAQNDLEAFQLKKQQKLNELDRVVVLRLHQILHHAGDGNPPSSTTSCLVFPEITLSDLSLRISTVKEERKTEKMRFKELHHEHVKLLRERRELEGRVKDWKEKLEQTMTLKFGRVVDLDSLGAVTANRVVDELRSKLKRQEDEQGRELAVLQGRIERAKQQLVGVVRENTQQLVKLTDLLTSQQSLEARLNARQKSLRGEVGGGRGEDEEELDRLQQLTVLQAQEIAALQQEIRSLSMKGGKILPPSQPPVGPPPPGVSPII